MPSDDSECRKRPDAETPIHSTGHSLFSSFRVWHVLGFLFVARYFLKAESSYDTVGTDDLILWPWISGIVDSSELVFWIAGCLCLYAIWISFVTQSSVQVSGVCLGLQSLVSDPANRDSTVSPQLSHTWVNLLSQKTGLDLQCNYHRRNPTT